MTEEQPEAALEDRAAARFELERTRIAYENLMMSWIRTATSLITFGFSIYKFFQIEGYGNVYATRLVGPREFALALEYRQNMRVLKAQYPKSPRSLAGLVAAPISVVALAAVIFRQ